MDDNFDYLDFKKISKTLYEKKYLIIFLSFLTSFVFFCSSLLLPNYYKSEVILTTPVNSSSDVPNIPGGYSTLATFAGISLNTSENKIDESIEVLNSLMFFEEFINKNDLFFKFFATRGWNKNDNKLIVNPRTYNTQQNKWVSKDKFAVNGKPSTQSAFRDFQKLFHITKKRESGFLVISIEHYSPYVAKETLETIIQSLNNKMRQRDIDNAQRQINYLEKQALETQFNDVKIGINNIIQKHIETIALAKSSEQYALIQLSPPIAPEIKYRPLRSIITLLAFFVSIIIYSSIIILKEER